MKFRRNIAMLVAGVILAGSLSACGSKPESSTTSATTPTPTPAASTGGDTATATPEPTVDETAAKLAEFGLDENRKFADTRSITVEVYDRMIDNGTKPDDNFFTDFIKKSMLEKHNVDVSYKTVARWTEKEDLNLLLAAGDAPDICVTYDAPTIFTYANMGGVIDLDPIVTGNQDIFPNLWEFLGPNYIYYDRDPDKSELWKVEAKLALNLSRNTFVREDWMKKLNLTDPTTVDEFEAMLVAFKDNAELLLGENASKMIPYSTSFDVGYRNELLFSGAFIPSDLTDKDKYVNGFDNYRLLYPNYKEGVRKLNDWYNKGLVWKDFALYAAGDTTEDDNMKAGYVGSYSMNWDHPYRNGEDGIHSNLQRNVGPEAAFIAINPFKGPDGKYTRYLSYPVDRKVFFPATNDQPIASMLYLDWLSILDNRKFIQIGVEGINHEVLENGAVKAIAATGKPEFMNSPNNIDYTILINGIDLGDPELNAKSLALGYAGVDSRFIEKSYSIGAVDAQIGKVYAFPEIKSENGMGPALNAKRDVLLDQSVVTTPDKFDSVFDAGMSDYLASGGQAIVDERTQRWTERYGSGTEYIVAE